jgi:hypothetical protein
MQRQRLNDIGGQHRYPVLSAFAVANEDLIQQKVDIFDPQSEAFHQSKAAAVKRQAGRQAGRP